MLQVCLVSGCTGTKLRSWACSWGAQGSEGQRRAGGLFSVYWGTLEDLCRCSGAWIATCWGLRHSSWLVQEKFLHCSMWGNRRQWNVWDSRFWAAGLSWAGQPQNSVCPPSACLDLGMWIMAMHGRVIPALFSPLSYSSAELCEPASYSSPSAMRIVVISTAVNSWGWGQFTEVGCASKMPQWKT